MIEHSNFEPNLGPISLIKHVLFSPYRCTSRPAPISTYSQYLQEENVSMHVILQERKYKSTFIKFVLYLV